jgi:YidC/Oxa1 family membrane protein insertase
MQPSGGQGPNETRNVILAIVLSIGIFIGFDFFYAGPARERAQAERAEIEQSQGAARSAEAQGDAIGTPETPTTTEPARREQVLAASAAARVPIDTGAVDGSISLEGARIDDLNLRGYHRTVDDSSPEVTLLAPSNTEFGHYAFFGWEMQSGEAVSTVADARSAWSLGEGATTLTPQTPVTLRLDAGNGVTVVRTIAIDENFMFTITDVVTNTSGGALAVRPFGTVRREGLPEDYVRNQIVHQGLIGAFGENNTRHQVTFEDANKHVRDRGRGRVGEDERLEDLQGQGGWLGVTDHYWLTAIIPAQSERTSTYFDASADGATNEYRAAYRGDWHQVGAGAQITYTQHLFAGAKRYDLLTDYQSALDVPRLDNAIDWGNFYFLTRPFFAMLHWFGQTFAGWGIIFNFGLAILASTVVVKLLLFPLVYQSFKAMAKMRGMQPKMKELQERYAADKQRQQQELLRLYQTEKINPVSGCIPILLQIPVFYALYKTLTVTIEMRHEPFVGWIHDLSARDPTSLFNLFGLLPFDPSTVPLIGAFLMIGVWPILYGISMMALQALSPPPTDPIQAQIFRLLPILFTFMFAAFPAGLVIYWTWSNSLSILQQYVIMRRQGVETQLDTFLKKRFGKSEPSPAE